MWLNPVTLTLANEDTLSLRNLHLFVRTDGRFTADSLPLQITFLTPDSVRYEERFTLVVSHKHSPSSLGSETGSVYRRRVRLVHRGDYRLIINPITPTEGIESIGIYLTKSE